MGPHQQTQVVARQQPSLTRHTTTEELLETVFTRQSGPRLYNGDQRGQARDGVWKTPRAVRQLNVVMVSVGLGTKEQQFRGQ